MLTRRVVTGIVTPDQGEWTPDRRSRFEVSDGARYQLRPDADLAALRAKVSSAFSQARLAEVVGCSKAFIGHLESRRNQFVVAALGARIADALNVDVGELFLPATPTARRRRQSRN